MLATVDAGSVSKINAARDQIDNDQYDDFIRDVTDVHTLASLFKMFFRELPRPLIHSDLYDSCVRVGGQS